MDVIADDLATIPHDDADGVIQADFIVPNCPTLPSLYGAVLNRRVILLADEILHGDILGVPADGETELTSLDLMTGRIVGDVNLVRAIVEIERARNDLGE